MSIHRKKYRYGILDADAADRPPVHAKWSSGMVKVKYECDDDDDGDGGGDAWRRKALLYGDEVGSGPSSAAAAPLVHRSHGRASSRRAAAASTSALATSPPRSGRCGARRLPPTPSSRGTPRRRP